MGVSVGQETEKQAMARKLYLMRKMLKNERRANDLINEKLNRMTHEVHGNKLTASVVDKVMSEDAQSRVMSKSFQRWFWYC